MKINNRAYYISSGLLAIALLVWFLGWFYWDEYAAAKIAAFQKTEDWSEWQKRIPEGVSAGALESNDPQIPIEKKPGLYLRTDSLNNLLLRHNYGKEVYLYDLQTKNIKRITDEDWSRAGGQITICRDQVAPEYNREISSESYPRYIARHKETILDSYGKYALAALESPTHTKAAILSAYGSLSGPGRIGWIGLGGSEPTVHGRRYVQILQLNNHEYTQEPVRLAYADGKYEFNLCWSQNEKYVVAYQPYENFSIIETNISDK
jgi:hypothetical protein